MEITRQDGGESYPFQVNLSGIIELLSNHLYSSPRVFVRELLQNAADALTARRLLEPGHAGAVRIEVLESAGHGGPVIVFGDDGVGLTESEMHEFLATIGQTSKRDELAERRGDFIGQFGIGLLSCFLVCDEIVVRTRSARGGARPLEWCGRVDGTYSITDAEGDFGVGTRVRLLCKPGSEEYFEPETVLALARNYGGLLPYPVMFTAGGRTTRANSEPPPWTVEFSDPADEREAYLQFGREVFGADFPGYVPLRSEVGGVEGAAFILPHSPGMSARRTHRVYLKDMLLSEDAEGLLPEWAFFVKCVINARSLRPSASRETFYEDEALREARAALGRCLKQHLVALAADDPEGLRKLVSLHGFSIKALSAEDDECFLTFREWLPFETNMGQLALGEYLRQTGGAVRYVTNLDEFRQVAGIAASQGVCLINAAFAFDQTLLTKLKAFFPDVRVEWADAASLTLTFGRLTPSEEGAAAGFVGLAGDVLGEFGCEVELRRFEPPEVPAVYLAGSDAVFHRAVEEAKEVADPLWSSVLDGVASARQAAEARLCFNISNPLVFKVSRVGDANLQRLYIRMLYIQALLLGHRPLRRRELKLLNDTLSSFLEYGLESEGGWVQ
jgi:molecular chaperone HtpG